LDCHDAELSIVITDDDNIAKLNEKYLNRKGATNVISFPMLEGDFSDISPNLLGDIVISADTAEKESKIAKISFEKRLFQLLIHGLLHLLGYDHEKNEVDAIIMEKKEKELEEIICIS
jgi:probable rRNA maturation factor